ncbi:MAG: ABC transporter ATP-binding protein [Ruminococcaceae bacterium]|nr:ABC transporter ATP-binding protein [Oscillospiraceae bacterium]
MSDILISLRNIKKSYDGIRFVLNGLCLDVKNGENIIISGPSGCGKSTLLNILALLEIFDSGDYLFDGERVNPRHLNRFADARAKSIGFVFQSYGLIESLSVADNIYMPFLYTSETMNKQSDDYMDVLLDELNLKELKNKKTSLLSGGEKQRVAIARAILKKPRLVIADEPTGNLDYVNEEQVISAFNRINKTGTSIIMVTHKNDLKLDNCRKLKLSDGVLHDA